LPAPFSDPRDKSHFSGHYLPMFINLPGISGSDRDHWQSHWEAQDPAFCRFAPSSWDAPELSDWMTALTAAVSRSTSPPVLVAHSLACLLVAHWAEQSELAIAGAFLVSVPDPSGPNFPSEASSFRDVPETVLPFPTLILASSDDAYGSVTYARTRASQWCARLIELGPLGHINSESRLAGWVQGRQLLSAFAAGCTQRSSGWQGRE
jgi:predicted alpha/beta hydrolase family esterase